MKKSATFPAAPAVPYHACIFAIKSEGHRTMIGLILFGLVIAAAVIGAVVASIASVSEAVRNERERIFSLVARRLRQRV
jgi:hypothetical protein